MTSIVLHEGDNRVALRRLIDQGVRVHSVVTDPPYHLESITKRFGKDGAAPAKFGSDGAFARSSRGFMGSQWDGADASGVKIAFDPEFWRLIHDILLPGGYVVAFSGSRTGHWQACAMEMAGFIMHPFLGWVFGCLDTSSQCLTRRGWLSYTELTPEDEVAQWDSVSNTLSWVRPGAVHEYDFDGELVNLKNRHTDQLLTPNHRVYAKVRRHSRHVAPTAYEVLEAEELHRRSASWSVTLPMAAPLLGGDDVDPEAAYLAGWWLTDAWPHRDANACMFSQSKPETLGRLRTALAPYGPSEYVKKAKLPTHRDEHSFYLTGPMADWLRSQFPERGLPWSVLSWSHAARQRLYDGLMDGDGTVAETNVSSGAVTHVRTFWSKDQIRRDVFVALALSLGHRAYEDSAKGAVYINVATSTTELQTRHRSDRVAYKGKVWCLTVPTGAFVARRNGRPFITGNSGFPKAHNAAMAIDKQLGVQQGFVPEGDPVKRMIPGADQHATGDWTKTDDRQYQPGKRVPGSPEAAQWDGWAYGGQALKPAIEPIFVGQKPFSEKNGALNLLKHGVGAINIDGCRVPADGGRPLRVGDYKATDNNTYSGRLDDSLQGGSKAAGETTQGRHPANLLHDGSDEVVALFPQTTSGKPGVMRKGVNDGACYGAESRKPGTQMTGFGDSGSAARFFNSFPLDADPIFYQGKASKADRAGSRHPTVKPVALMQWLVRLVTPVGGVTLDPFAGSGTTGEAARREGFDCILMEAEEQFIGDIRRRFGLPAPVADFDDFDALLEDDFSDLL